MVVKRDDKTTMEKNIYDFQIRILLSKDDGDYVAHALEMDLVAYGKTESKALEELDNLIRNQISFAIEKRQDNLMICRAPDEYFEQWEKAHADALKGMISQGKCAKIHIKATSICFSHHEISELKKLSHRQRFELT